MKIHRSQQFIDSPRARKWLDEIINYISASYTNPALWIIIQELAKKRDAARTRFLERKALEDGVSIEGLPREYRNYPLENGEPATFFSIRFYLELSAEMKSSIDGYSAGGSLHSVGEAFQLLLDASVLIIPYNIYQRDDFKVPTIDGQVYRINEYFAKYLITNNLIYNHLFGFDYIIKKYSKSVVKIEVKHGQDVAIGTGWIYDIKTHQSGAITRVIVTNDHVIDGCSSIKILSVDDKVINHYEVESLKEKTGADVALIRIEYEATISAFILHHAVSLLEDIVTIGYPSVPLSRASYQVVHRGEVNAHVTDYFGQDLLVISSRTAPGNSGSPVIDDTGRVVGMVTQQLFEKAAFEQKGITPYSACIPSDMLLQVIEKSAIIMVNHHL